MRATSNRTGAWQGGGVTTEPDAVPEADVAGPAPDAVVAAAAAKAGLVWVSAGGRPAQSLWHVWTDDAVTVVVGGREQPDPVGDATLVELTVPSKDTRARLVQVEAAVEQVAPDDERWDPLTTALSGARLNATDSPGQVAAWAQGSRVLRLVPRPGAHVGAEAHSGAGEVRVDVEAVTPRGWIPLRSRLRPRRR